MMARVLFIMMLLIFISCKSSKTEFQQSAASHVKLLLIDGHYSLAQLEYFSAKDLGTLDEEFVSRYDQFFRVIALYDYEYERQPKPPYRYASCADLTDQGNEAIEWRSIAVADNPFQISKDKIKAAQEELTSHRVWTGPIDGVATAEFQKAIMFYRFLYGMNVECVLYPYDLMLKSTYCSLFEKDLRCQQGYEF